MEPFCEIQFSHFLFYFFLAKVLKGGAPAKNSFSVFVALNKEGESVCVLAGESVCECGLENTEREC